MRSHFVLLLAATVLAACGEKKTANAEPTDADGSMSSTTTSTLDMAAPPHSGPTQAHNDPGDPQPMASGPNGRGRPQQ